MINNVLRMTDIYRLNFSLHLLGIGLSTKLALRHIEQNFCLSK